MEINLKGIKEIDFTTKSVFISLVMVFPFWFVSIYLFDKQLLINNIIYVPIIFSICFSILWYMINIALALLICTMVKGLDIDVPIIAGGIVSIIYLGLIIFVLYILQHCYSWNITYLKFLIASFCYIIFRILLIVLVYKPLKEALQGIDKEIEKL